MSASMPVPLPEVDVAATRAFFETYFGFTPVSTAGNGKLAVLLGDGGFVLTLMHGDQPSYPTMFHIGFAQDSDDQVNAIYDRLHADGVADIPPKRMHGAWTFYFRAPGGIQVEVLHQAGVR